MATEVFECVVMVGLDRGERIHCEDAVVGGIFLGIVVAVEIKYFAELLGPGQELLLEQYCAYNLFLN